MKVKGGKMKKIGYQGEEGSYSDVAVIKYFGEDVAKKSYSNFIEMMEDMNSMKLDYCVLPIENTTTGPITRAVDLLKDYDMQIIGEEYVDVNHCLIGFKNAEFKDIEVVYSHPEALKQCDQFFEKYEDIKKVAYIDTAKSVEYIKTSGDKTKGALASYRAAEIHDMKIIKKNMQDNKNNITRFAVISKNVDYHKRANRVSMYLVTNHSAGSLYEVVKIFNDKGINMLKLESRPIVGESFSYGFYIDVEGNLEDKNITKALYELGFCCKNHKILGNYISKKG